MMGIAQERVPPMGGAGELRARGHPRLRNEVPLPSPGPNGVWDRERGIETRAQGRWRSIARVSARANAAWHRLGFRHGAVDGLSGFAWVAVAPPPSSVEGGGWDEALVSGDGEADREAGDEVVEGSGAGGAG